MSQQIEFEGTIKGGLPVKISATYYPGQAGTYYEPSFEPEIQIEEVKFLSGHTIRWELSEDDNDYLLEQASEFLHDEAISAAEYMAKER